jgi:dephospho-CoA kinase
VTAFLGVTGNSGTGQSTVAGVFGELGARVCSLDAAGHRLLDRFYVRSDLAMRLYRPELTTLSVVRIREELGLRAFRDVGVMDALESVLHPRMKRWASLGRRMLDGEGGVTVLEGALIYELGLDRLLDRVVVVTDTIERAGSRLENRDGVGTDIVSARWQRQWPIERKAGLADFVLENSGSLGELNDAARNLYISLLDN